MSTTIRLKPIIRSTKVSSSNNNRSPRNTPSQVLNTSDLEASAADLTFLKQDSTESSGGLTVPILFQIPKTTGPTDSVARIRGRVVGGSGGSPLGVERRSGRSIVVVGMSECECKEWKEQ